jgi:hypothetical protein
MNYEIKNEFYLPGDVSFAISRPFQPHLVLRKKTRKKFIFSLHLSDCIIHNVVFSTVTTKKTGASQERGGGKMFLRKIDWRRREMKKSSMRVTCS